MDLHTKIDQIQKDITTIKVDVAVLKVKFKGKVTLWSGITAGIVAIIVTLIPIILK